MVMHARKLPRINDGYHERHQQGHSSYQNSKYSSSKSNSYPDRYNQDRSDRSRNSPNGNTSRSNTPERDHSPRNRTYSNKTWYIQKLHEKERDRSYRNDQGRDRQNNKEKYYPSDYTRSPKDRRPVNKESGYPTNHDRNNSDKSNNVGKTSGQLYGTSKDSQRKQTHSNVREKRDERDRSAKVGDWSEHTSSSGKKYYYNCKTEVSQWEKPREWLEKEGLSHLLRPSGSSSSRQVQDKHSINRSNSTVNNYRDHPKYSHAREMVSSGSAGWNNRDNHQPYKDEHYSDHRIHESSSNASGAIVNELQTQDMEISSENSTPTSEHYTSMTAHQHQHHQMMDVHIPQSSASGPGPPVTSSCSMPPKLLHCVSRTELKPESTSSYSSALNTMSVASASLCNDKLTENNIAVNQSKIDPNNICDTGGPPTPTHSETQDDPEQKAGGSPETTTAGVSALHGVQLQGFYPMQLPQLTPGLSQFVNNDLTEHVRGWPAEACERQAHKLATEAHLITSMRITDISIALKSARSRVRLNEIQSTLLEQRVMLYRHEVKSLENMKTPSLFTTDDDN
ncbi:hypothetical protein V9T40_011681 [Parthenolecanium corni]|uniref:WW domain-containing protein n=1 Tax=Parthenolecanium corni TaxID=536013 RepID=A0AAN9T888_9HEMI